MGDRTTLTDTHGEGVSPPAVRRPGRGPRVAGRRASPRADRHRSGGPGDRRRHHLRPARWGSLHRPLDRRGSPAVRVPPTPETTHPARGVDPYGPEAAAYTTARLTGATVRRDLDPAGERYRRLRSTVAIRRPRQRQELQRDPTTPMARHRDSDVSLRPATRISTGWKPRRAPRARRATGHQRSSVTPCIVRAECLTRLGHRSSVSTKRRF